MCCCRGTHFLGGNVRAGCKQAGRKHARRHMSPSHVDPPSPQHMSVSRSATVSLHFNTGHGCQAPLPVHTPTAHQAVSDASPQLSGSPCSAATGGMATAASLQSLACTAWTGPTDVACATATNVNDAREIGPTEESLGSTGAPASPASSAGHVPTADDRYALRVATQEDLQDVQVVEEWPACPETGQNHGEVVAVPLPVAYLQQAHQLYVTGILVAQVMHLPSALGVPGYDCIRCERSSTYVVVAATCWYVKTC